MNDTDDEYIPNRTALREYAIPERDDVDDLVDSLWRHGSAQDYPAPEPEYPAYLQVRHLNERRWSHYHEYTDLRSLTHDLKLDDPPVPGYADFPQHIARKLNFENPPMPSKSPKQARLMAAAAHNPAFAKRAGVPPKVAREFNQADTRTGILKTKKAGK